MLTSDVSLGHLLII